MNSSITGSHRRTTLAGILAAVALVGALAIQPAGARAEAVTLSGAGSYPDVAVLAGGEGRVAWSESRSGSPDVLRACTLAVAATACSAGASLTPSTGSTNDSDSAGPYVLLPGSGSELLLDGRCCGIDGGLDKDLLSSTDGATFGAPVKSGRELGAGTGIAGQAIYLPAGSVTGLPGASIATINGAQSGGGGALVQVTTAGADTTTESFHIDPSPTVAAGIAFSAGQLVAAYALASDGSLRFRRYSGSGDPNLSSSWSPAAAAGSTDALAALSLAGGPRGIWLLAAHGRGQTRTYTVARFNATGFGTPVDVTDPGAGDAYLFQDPSGVLHVVWQDGAGELRHRFTTDAANSIWNAPQTIAASNGAGYKHLRAATDAGGNGWVVWDSGTTTPVHALPLTPLPPSPPPPAAPAASFQAPKVAKLHVPIIFSAAGATIPPGSTLNWDLNGDGKPDATCPGTQNALITRFLSGGTRTIGLRVLAPNGQTSLYQQTLTIANAAARRAGVPAVPPQQITGCFAAQAGAAGNTINVAGLCVNTLEFGIVQATGCLHEVTGLDQIPAAERAMLILLRGQAVHGPVPYSTADSGITAAASVSAGQQHSAPAAALRAAIATGGIYVVGSNEDPGQFVARSNSVKVNGVEFYGIQRYGCGDDGNDKNAFGAIVISVPDHVILSSCGGAAIRDENSVHVYDLQSKNRRYEQFLPVSSQSTYTGAMRLSGDLTGFDIRSASFTFTHYAAQVAATVGIQGQCCGLNLVSSDLLDDQGQAPTAQVTAVTDNQHGLHLPDAMLTGFSASFDNGGLTLSNGAATYGSDGRWTGTVDVGGQLSLAGAELGFKGGYLDNLTGAWIRGVDDTGHFSLGGRGLAGAISQGIRGPNGFHALYQGPFDIPLASGDGWPEDPVGNILKGHGGALRVSSDLSQDFTLFPADFDGWGNIISELPGDIFAPAVGDIGSRMDRSLTGWIGQDGRFSFTDQYMFPASRASTTGCLVDLGCLFGVQFGIEQAGAWLTGNASLGTGGFSYNGVVRRWGQDPQINADGARALASQSRAADSGSVRLAAGLPAVYIVVHGRGGAPTVSLTEPSGTVLAGPVADQLQSSGAGYVGIRAPGLDETYFLVAKPAAGTWHVVAAGGSAPIVAIVGRRPLAPVHVTAKLAGAPTGARRALRYAIARITGQRVTILATGPGGQQTLAAVSGGGIGTVQVALRPGLGRRLRLTAQVTENGVPRIDVALGTVSAPDTLPAPGGLRLSRHRGRLVARWGAVAGAVAYVAMMQSSDGRRVSEATGPNQRSVTFALGPAFQVAHVRVVAVGADRHASRVATGEARASKPGLRSTRRGR